jgi:hypothetical protein
MVKTTGNQSLRNMDLQKIEHLIVWQGNGWFSKNKWSMTLQIHFELSKNGSKKLFE